VAKEKGTIENALSKTIHHVAEHKVDLIFMASTFSGRDFVKEMKYRFQLVRDNLEPIMRKVEELRVAADTGDLEKVREILNSQVEYGHKWPDHEPQKATPLPRTE
jgi:hypothetical protein